MGPEHGGRGTRFLADSPVSVRGEGRLQVQRGRGLGVSGQFCLVTSGWPVQSAAWQVWGRGDAGGGAAAPPWKKVEVGESQ